jgi:hypothetical protein
MQFLALSWNVTPKYDRCTFQLFRNANGIKDSVDYHVHKIADVDHSVHIISLVNRRYFSM